MYPSEGLAEGDWICPDPFVNATISRGDEAAPLDGKTHHPGFTLTVFVTRSLKLCGTPPITTVPVTAVMVTVCPCETGMEVIDD